MATRWYCVQVITYSYNGSVASMAYNSTLKDTASFEVTPIQSDTVYNISVIPCNMAGCNESCDVHLVQTESETSIIGGKIDKLHNIMLHLSHYYNIAVAINCLALEVILKINNNNNTGSRQRFDSLNIYLPLTYTFMYFLYSTNGNW